LQIDFANGRQSGLFYIVFYNSVDLLFGLIFSFIKIFSLKEYRREANGQRKQNNHGNYAHCVFAFFNYVGLGYIPRFAVPVRNEINAFVG